MRSVHFLIPMFLLFAFHSLQDVRGSAELKALMDLKSSLDPEGKVLSSWTSVGDPCGGSFVGVACNEHQKVANISLQGRYISGRLSPAVAQLKCLSGLYLHYNNLSGEIPREISNLTELVDLYLDVNNLSGAIPPEIGKMASLQVLQLCYNQLVGTIPEEMGSLKQLSFIALQYNRLSGQIPRSLGNVGMLMGLNLSFNNFTGTFPATLADISRLETLDVRNNSLSGQVPPALRRLGDGFHGGNNLGLCGIGFSTLSACSKIDNPNVSPIVSNSSINSSPTKEFPNPPNLNQTHCSNSIKFPHIIIAAGVITITITFLGAGFLIFVRCRQRKLKIRNASESSEGQFSPDQPKQFYSRSPSPLVNLDYHNGLGLLANEQNSPGLSHENLNRFRYNIDEVDSATQYLSEANLLGRSKFSSVYKGVLRDGSPVAIRSINETCCRAEEAEFVGGLNLLVSLRHDNLVRLRGFCCSGSRGECFLIYDFAPNGDLSQYLDVEDRSGHLLDWSKRFSIIKGIAKGIAYLHSNGANKPTLVHQNISVEKILLDHQFKPMIMDAGLPKLLANDVVFSALKVSAAMGYLAPEYITTGRFTEKSDIYAFGVIVLQVLSGKKTIGSSVRTAVESFRFEEFVDTNLNGRYTKSEAAVLAKLAMQCTHELPDERPNMEEVIKGLSIFPAYS